LTPPSAGPRSVTAEVLCNATLDIPVSPGSDRCPHGRVAFSHGSAVPPPDVAAFVIAQVAYADVDHDGVNDTVARIGCQVGESDAGQVLVFDRAPGGGIRAKGRVLAADFNAVMRISGIDGKPDGSVWVMVSNVHASDGWGYWAATHQWRTFGWTGHGFTQTGGSTSFLADHAKADLTVTASPVVFDKPSAGQRVGQLTVTVHNGGTRPVERVSVFAYFPGHELLSGACFAINPPVDSPACPIGTAPAGGTWQTTITLLVNQLYLDQAGTPDWSSPDGGIQLKVGDQVYTELHTFTATYQ
jgi:hypothetical protein